MNNFTFGGLMKGRQFVYYETIAGGQGGGPLGDGISGRHSHMTNTLNTPVEVIEHGLPVRVLEYRLREKSGGRGQHRGGDGIRRVYEFLSPATITINSERRIYAPYGLQGGGEGERGVNRVVQGGKARTVSGKFTTQVNPGDQVIIETPGGGGWGTSR
jgi:N-methylhydantoinase B